MSNLSAYMVLAKYDNTTEKIGVFLTRAEAEKAMRADAETRLADFSHPENVSGTKAVETLQSGYEIYLSVVKLTGTAE